MSKKKAIRQKVSSLVIKISLSSVIIVGIIAIGSLLILRSNTINVSRALGEMAAGDSRYALEDVAEQQLLELAGNIAALSDATLLLVQNSVKMIAQGAQEIASEPDRFLPNPVPLPDPANAGIMVTQLLFGPTVSESVIAQQSDLFGNIQGLLLNVITNNVDATAVYIGTEEGIFIQVDEDSHYAPEFFDPRERSWYQLAAAQGSLIWSDVFIDANTGAPGIASAMPFFDADGTLAGVAGVGTLLDAFAEIVIGAEIGQTGYAFVLNEVGQIIIGGDMEIGLDGEVIREDLLNSDNPEVARVAQAMVDGQTGIRRITMDSDEYFIAFAPLSVLPWSLAAVIEVQEVIAPALATGESIINMGDDAIDDITLIISAVIVAFVVILAAIALIVSYTSRKFSVALTKPIEVLTDGVVKISTGDLEQKVIINTGDELETLARSFNIMTTNLREHIDLILEMHTENERISTELNVATQIQSSMLPCIFPAFPARDEFDIYATMIPAREVGGDFYDFFLIDSDKLAMVMADVSGKGIPAALFMVIAKTLIKNNAQYGKSPKEVFETVNNLLCENNDAGMFVTVFMGVFDIPTGKLTYVNAGHNPPLIMRAGGDYEWLPTKPGLVIAGMEGMKYRQEEIKLNSGDAIFMYTDGVTEAANPKDELFGDLKLLETANRYKSSELDDFMLAIKSEIDLFADGAEQADDITMLVMKVGE